jgi:aminopeptidase N
MEGIMDCFESISRREIARWVLGLLTVFASDVVTRAQPLFASDSLARPSREYHVVHYKLQVSFEEEHKKVLGSTSITLTPLVQKMDSVVFDAVDMNVEHVALRSSTYLRFRNRSPLLVVYFDQTYSFMDTMTVVVDYTCTPTKGLYFIQPDSTDPRRHDQIWTQGEDSDNRCWFPCYDYPNDKATSEVIATVRDTYTLLSNGRLLKMTQDPKKKTRTFHWSQSKPHSSYLIMLAAGEYQLLQDQYRSVPLQYYVYKNQVEDARRTFGGTPAIMKFFEEKLGYPYPWEKYAQIIIDDFMWGGMENTSAVTLNTTTMIDARGSVDFSSDPVIAHELAHQWWGDVVTCRDWDHLWLHEGFADYCEALYKKHDKGRDEFEYGLMQAAKSIFRSDEMQGRKPIVSHNSFTTNLYARGGWVLHMLHSILGEEQFWQALNYYIRRHEFRNVDTHEFALAVEDATGRNLDWFFDEWVYKAGYPDLVVTTSWDESLRSLAVTIKQRQTVDSLTGLFTFPMEIACTTEKGTVKTSVWVRRQEETVSIPLSEKPRLVVLDEEQNVLKSLSFERSKDELLYQLEHAEGVVARVEAARLLRARKDDAGVFKCLSKSALHDPFWGVRREATISIGVMDAAGVQDTLLRIYGDRDSHVRHAAIVALERFKTQDVANFVEQAARSDSSYVVLASCIEAMAQLDSTRAFTIARRYVDMESYRDIVRRASLGAMYELRDKRALPFAYRYAQPGNAADTRLQALRLLGEVGADDSTARSRVLLLMNDGSPFVRSDAARVLGEWGGDSAQGPLQKRMEAEKDENVKKVIQEVLKRAKSHPEEDPPKD